MSQRTKATLEQMEELFENEDDLMFQRPRSHSFPNLTSMDFEDEYDSENDHFPQKDNERLRYVFKQERNFGYEIQEFFHLKKEMRKRKMQIMNGQEAQSKLKEDNDPEQAALAKK